MCPVQVISPSLVEIQDTFDPMGLQNSRAFYQARNSSMLLFWLSSASLNGWVFGEDRFATELTTGVVYNLDDQATPEMVTLVWAQLMPSGDAVLIGNVLVHCEGALYVCRVVCRVSADSRLCLQLCSKPVVLSCGLWTVGVVGLVIMLCDLWQWHDDVHPGHCDSA